MKINKYNVPKSTESSSRTSGGTVVVSATSSVSAEVCDEAKRLKETHLIFGQPFNGTADVSGDLTNVQNITASGGDITVKADNGIGGNITAEGNVTAKKFIGDVEADDVTTNTLTAESGTINSLSGESLTYNNADIKQAVIEALTSVDIVTENLTVTKLAHFFELVIDKIKAAGVLFC